MGDDARVADLFLVVEDSLIFLPRTEEQATSRPLGSTGGWRGRCRNPLIISCGDWRSTPPEFWGTRDWEEARGNGQPLNPSLPPAPPQLTLSGFTLFASSPKPERRSDRSRAADAALHRFGVR